MGEERAPAEGEKRQWCGAVQCSSVGIAIVIMVVVVIIIIIMMMIIIITITTVKIIICGGYGR
jgi:hypothetical protein